MVKTKEKTIKLSEQDINDLIDGQSLIAKIGRRDYEIKRIRK